MSTQQKINLPEAITEITTYAGYLDRFVSTCIDILVMLPVWYLAHYLLLEFFKGQNFAEPLTRIFPQMLPGFILVMYCLVYMPVMDATGGTIGKRVMHIESVDATTLHKAHFMYHFARGGILMVLCTLLFVPAFLSGATMFFTEKKQTIHDLIGNIIVVKKGRL
jgi:uncharacterized RDD family membrane protein YckC